MGRKLEWELSGKSDVPQKMADAKKSMEGLDGAANGLSKKFKEAFKDIAVGFIAPMVLVQKAIGFIADKVEEAKQKVKEASDFAKEEESKRYSAPGGREANLQAQQRALEKENKEKGRLLAYRGYVSFLSEDPRGRQMLKEEGKKDFWVREALVRRDAEGAASRVITGPRGEEIKKRINEILQPDVAARQAADDAKKAAEKPAESTAASAQKVAELSSNVVGVGMSPQLEALKQQTDLLTSIDYSLRAIIDNDFKQSNPNFTSKGQVGSQSMSGFVYGSTGILGQRISR